ncbi:hypothetical protein KR054_012271 [Drosophila jambulina]|nr:hypothetical protein KR054_012271 [Drosophila jambulina]
MHNIATLLFGALAAFTFWHGSLAKDQDQGNNRDAENETKAQMDRLQSQLQGLEENFLAIQTKLESQHLAFTKLENQLQSILNKMEAPQQAFKVEVQDSDRNTIPSGFQQIGSRYFRIVKDKFVNWETAERRCREMGGYLASFRNEEEITGIKAILDWRYYWLGINDRDSEGHFLSVASNKPAQFLLWSEGQPNDEDHQQNCVTLREGEMLDVGCSSRCYFICQADNET